jgi:hypothetical protein
MSLLGGANDWITERGQQVAHLFVEPSDHTLELQNPDILEREADYVFHVLWKFASQRIFLWDNYHQHNWTKASYSQTVFTYFIWIAMNVSHLKLNRSLQKRLILV